MEKLIFYNDNQGVLIQQIEITAISLGTVGLASSDDTRLRIFNPNDTYQADGVVVTSDFTDQLLLSVDGETFAATAALGDIAPNGVSDPFFMRRITPSTAALGAVTGKLRVAPTYWVAPIDTSTSDDISLDDLDAEDPDDTGEPGDYPDEPDLDDPNTT